MRNHWLELHERKTKPPTWFTDEQLLQIFNHAVKYSSKETISKSKPLDWNGQSLSLYEIFYIAWIRARNLMFRRTLDKDSKQWMVVSPAMTTSGIFPGFQFGNYSTPGEPGGKYIQKPWQDQIQEEVSFNVFRVGSMNYGVSTLYIAPEFPDNVVLLGMGHKQVTQFNVTGKMETQVCDNGFTFEYPEMIPYLGSPTHKNYALIKLGE